ncbi:MAG: magnesium transporter [Pontibacterium sp.]
MENPLPNEGLQDFVSQLHDRQLDNKAVFEQALLALDTAQLSLLLASVPIEERLLLWQQIPVALTPAVITRLKAQAREPILQAMDDQALDGLLQQLDAEGLIELTDQLSEAWLDKALGYLDARQKQYFEQANTFESNQIGRFVDHNILTLTINAKIKDAIRVIKRGQQSTLDHIYLMDRNNTYVGTVLVKDVLREPDELKPISELIAPSIPTIIASTLCIDAIDSLDHASTKNLPVLDGENRLVGRLTYPTALTLLRQHYDAQLMAKAGMAESADLFVPILKGARHRAVWLGINLLTAFLASWTIGLFETVLSQVVALAVLMPVVASMGGIAGSQTLALIMRGIALGQVTLSNAFALSRQELGIALINGIGWGLVIGIVAFYWFNSLNIAFVIAFAVCANIQAAAVSGVYLPLLLTKLKIDPALSGAVLLTTVTDVFGFVTFLGLGTLLLI